MSHTKIGYDKLIREQGYRLTPQREIIMELLCEIGGHASANEVYDRLQDQAPTIDRATVYRTLHFFRELHLVSATEIDGELLYEVSNVRPHHHLHCCVCGAEQTFKDDLLQDLIDRLQQEFHFTAEIDHLVINGRCRNCQ